MGFVCFQGAFLFCLFFILRQAGTKMEHIVNAKRHYFPLFKLVLTAVEFPAFVTDGSEHFSVE